MDPNQNQYIADPSILVLDICRGVFEGYANRYMLGLPTQPFTDLDYPAVVVQQMESEVEIGATSTDDQVERIVIYIFTNKDDNVGDANDPGITTMRELHNLVEGKAVGIGNAFPYWQSNTLFYQLRKQLTLSQNVNNSSISIKYDSDPIVDENGKRTGAITAAAITVTLTEQVLVLGRS